MFRLLSSLLGPIILGLVFAPEIAADETPLQAAVKKLNDGKPEVAIRAAEDIAKLGDAGRPAARALCEAAMNGSYDVRQATLAALEKVHPALHGPVFTLLMNPTNRLNAIPELGKLGTEAAAALPLMRKNLAAILETPKGRSRDDKAASLYIEALAKIAPGDDEIVRYLAGLCTFQDDRAKRYAGLIRRSAVDAVGTIGKARPQARVIALPALIKAAQDGGEVSVRAIRILGTYGPDAREAGAALSKLKMHDDEGVRYAASEALGKIEK